MTNRPDFNITNTTYSLSIQLSLSGFSFCISSNENKIITYFENDFETQHHNERELLEQLKSIFETKPELQATFKKVELTYQNELFSFVPLDLFDEENKTEYLKYSVKTLATDYIAHDTIKNTSIVNVFIPFMNINNYIIDVVGTFNYQHSSGLLLQHILDKNKTQQITVYLYINQHQFDICVVKNQELLLFNSFLKANNEDVLYYLLFCMEQLELSTESTPVKLLSPIEDELHQLIYTYVRNVEKASFTQNNLLHKIALNIT